MQGCYLSRCTFESYPRRQYYGENMYKTKYMYENMKIWLRDFWDNCKYHCCLGDFCLHPVYEPEETEEYKLMMSKGYCTYWTCPLNINCTTCSSEGDCSFFDWMTCMYTGFTWWYPKSDGFCRGCSMWHTILFKCCRHAEPCHRNEEANNCRRTIYGEEY